MQKWNKNVAWFQINQIWNDKSNVMWMVMRAQLRFLIFTAFKVYRLKRQLLWQQSVWQQSFQIRTFVAHICATNIRLYCQHSLVKDIGKDEIIVKRMNYWIWERIICSNLSTIVLCYQFSSVGIPNHHLNYPYFEIMSFNFNLEYN